MSQSSLPDIFRKLSPDKINNKKQGGQFSLRLTSQSVEKHVSSRAGYAPGDQTYVTLNATKRRSISTASIQAKPSILRQQNWRKVDTARDKIPVSFKEQVELWTGPQPRQKGGLSVLNLSNFPYETNRKFNNMTIDLEEGDSLKNKTEFNLKETGVLLQVVQTTREEIRQQRVEFQSFIREKIRQMEDFQAFFSNQLDQTYSNLSKMRRQTNKTVKQNKGQTEKVTNEFDVCYHVCQDLSQKTKQLYTECLVVPKQQNQQRESTPFLDFEEISSIPKTSRGATGDQSRRKIIDLLKRHDNQRRSADFDGLLPKGGVMTLNGKEIQILSLED